MDSRHLNLLLLCLSATAVIPLQTDAASTIPVAISPESLIIHRGSLLRLRCSVNASSPYSADDLLWYFNGEELSDQFYEVEGRSTVSLSVEEADFANSGTYSCGVAGDTAENAAMATVTVGTTPDGELSCRSPNHMNIFCSWKETFSNLPSTSTFSWRLYHTYLYESCGSDLDGDGVLCVYTGDNSCYFPVDHGTLHIMRLNLTNALGSKYIEMYFNPDRETIPNQPQNVMAEADSSESVTLTWSTPVDWKGHLYHLIYKTAYTDDPSSRSAWIEEIHAHNPDKTQHEFKGLEIFTEYSFRVACISEYANPEGLADDRTWSAWSDVATVRTKQAAPRERVEIIVNRYEETGDDETRTHVLEWQPLSPSEANGIILGYRIYVLVLHQTLSSSEMIDTKISQSYGDVGALVKMYNIPVNQTRYKLTGLNPHLDYHIDIVAYNSVDESPPASVTISAIQTDTKTVTEPAHKVALKVVAIVVGVIVFVILCVLLTRRGYRKLKDYGFFDPVAKPEFPFDFEDNDDRNVPPEKALLDEFVEVYDDLRRSGSKRSSKSIRPVDKGAFYSAGSQISCNAEVAGSKDKRGQYVKLRGVKDSVGSESNDVDEGISAVRNAKFVDLPPKTPLPVGLTDGYCQVTNDGHITQLPIKAQQTPQASPTKTARPEGYSQMTESGRAVESPWKLRADKAGNHSHQRADVERGGGGRTASEGDTTPYCQVTSGGISVVPAGPPKNLSTGQRSNPSPAPPGGYCELNAQGKPIVAADRNCRDSGHLSDNEDEAADRPGDREGSTGKSKERRPSGKTASRHSELDKDKASSRTPQQGTGGYCQVDPGGQPVMIDTDKTSKQPPCDIRNLLAKNARESTGEASSGLQSSGNSDAPCRAAENVPPSPTLPDYLQITQAPRVTQPSSSNSSSGSDYVGDYSQITQPNAGSAVGNAQAPANILSDYTQITTNQQPQAGNPQGVGQSAESGISSSSVDDYSRLSHTESDSPSSAPQQSRNVAVPAATGSPSDSYVAYDAQTDAGRTRSSPTRANAQSGSRGQAGPVGYVDHSVVIPPSPKHSPQRLATKSSCIEHQEPTPMNKPPPPADIKNGGHQTDNSFSGYVTQDQILSLSQKTPVGQNLDLAKCKVDAKGKPLSFGKQVNSDGYVQ